MPADPGIDDCRTCGFNGFCQQDGFIEGAAVVHEIEHRQAVDDNKIFSYALAYRAHHFHGKTHAVGVVAAPLVIALVGTGGQKFVDQISF